MVGVPALLDHVPLDAVGPDRLAPALPRLHPADEAEPMAPRSAGGDQ